MATTNQSLSYPNFTILREIKIVAVAALVLIATSLILPFLILLLLFPDYSSNKSVVVLTWQRVVELVLVAPIIENSIFFLLGYIARKISKNSWFLCLMAAMYVCLFVFMHYLGMGWLGLVTLPFALVLCYCACGLIWNERGKRWAFFRVTAIHSLLNGTICIARFFIGV